LGQASGVFTQIPERSATLHLPTGYLQDCPSGHFKPAMPPHIAGAGFTVLVVVVVFLVSVVEVVWAFPAPAASRSRAKHVHTQISVLRTMVQLLLCLRRADTRGKIDGLILKQLSDQEQLLFST